MRLLLTRLLDFAFPRSCCGCGPPTATGAPWLCATCLHGLPSAPASRTRDGVLVAAATLYQPGGATGRLVRAFKYDGARSLAAPLGGLLAARYAWDADVLVLPVPLHRRRLLDRGYNQAVLLARVLARRRRLEWTLDTLVRLRDTPTQTRLPARERRRNLAAAFVVRRPHLVRRRDVVVVDDVVTTGATADACAGTLLAVGARRVRVYAFAHTPTAAVVHAAPESLKGAV